MSHADEISEYVSEVRAALADLPPQQREELLEDLPEHLAEVAAEGQDPLRSRLGPPEQYAAELRAAIVDVGPPSDVPALGPRLAAAAGAVLTALRVRLRVVDARVGPVIGYAKVSDFLRLLRPAWWLLRGYLAAMAIIFVVASPYSTGLLPRVDGSAVLGGLLLSALVVGSIWLGRRQGGLDRWQRWLTGTASVLVAVVAAAGFVDVDEDVRSPEYYVSVDGRTYEDRSDIFVYDVDGRLLRDVRLYDQDGNPIPGGAVCQMYASPDVISGAMVFIPDVADNVFPRCPERDPFSGPGTLQPSSSVPQPSDAPDEPPAAPTVSPGTPMPSPTPLPTPSPSPSPSPVPSGTATAAPSPTG